MLFEAYLSFLGAGTPPNIPSWGNIMAEGRAYVQRAFWIILFPGAFLAPLSSPSISSETDCGTFSR
jgi:peptide/nickel transport system permease protein